MNKKSKQIQIDKGLYSKITVGVIGSILLLLTVGLEVVFSNTFPSFIEIIQISGMQGTSIVNYQRFTRVLLSLGGMLIVATVVGRLFTKDRNFIKSITTFYAIYAISLSVIFGGGIFVVYSNVYTMG